MEDKNEVKEMKEVKKQIEIRYEPYEKYLTRVLIAINTKLDKIAADQSVIKERITFDAAEPKDK